MKHCHIDINYTKNGLHDCLVFSIFDNEVETKILKRCKLPVGSVKTLDGAEPFECMDDVDVQLTAEGWAVVDALK